MSPRQPVPQPLIVIGLDGGTWDVLDQLAGMGQVPNISHLASNGLRTILRSTTPPATFPAWTSFLTATNPGVHGLTDIFVRLPGARQLCPASGHLRAQPTFLSRLSEMGLRVASLGVPGTFPPERINGICISGFDSPAATSAIPEAVWPPSLWPTLQSLGGWQYATFNEQAGGGKRLRSIADTLQTDLEAKERVILSLYQRERWDLFFVHLQASDTALHHLWHTFDPRSPRARHPELRHAVSQVFARIDRLVGRLRRLAPASARFLLVSDHGMGGASTTAVFLNRWLQQKGLLKFLPPSRRLGRTAVGTLLSQMVGRLPHRMIGLAARWLPRRFHQSALNALRNPAIDYAASLAFSDELDYGPSVWINRRGVFPHGIVAAHEAETLATVIADALPTLSVPGSGAPLIKRVHPRSTVLSGPHVARAPDLLIEPAWENGYRASFLVSHEPGPVAATLSPTQFDAGRGTGLPGVHHPDGIFAASGAGLPAMEIPEIDLPTAGALVFALLGIDVPATTEAAFPPFLDQVLPIRQTSAPSPHTPTPTRHPPTPELVVERRLRDLGYIE